MTGYLVRCSTCGREERTGENPLRDGWPKCHGTMSLIDTDQFIADVDRLMGRIMEPVTALRQAAAEDAAKRRREKATSES